MQCILQLPVDHHHTGRVGQSGYLAYALCKTGNTRWIQQEAVFLGIGIGHGVQILLVGLKNRGFRRFDGPGKQK